MAEEKKQEDSGNNQPHNVEHQAEDQQWFDPQGDFEKGETLKARQWETDHRLVDDNSILGNIHQGTEGAKDYLKTEGFTEHIITVPEGIELPEEQVTEPEKTTGEEMVPSAEVPGIVQPGVGDDGSIVHEAGIYESFDFEDISIQSFTDRAADIESIANVSTNGGDSGSANESSGDTRTDRTTRSSAVIEQEEAGDGVVPTPAKQPQEPFVREESGEAYISAAAVIAGEGGLVVEDRINQISGQLSISDPDPGESYFQSAIIKGHYGSFNLSQDGTWSYQLAVAQDNVQELAENELVSEQIEVLSADGTAYQLSITVQGTNDVPVFTSVVGQALLEGDSPVHGQLVAADRDHNDVLSYSIEQLVPGLEFNEDGSYLFDPGHEDYQNLPEGETRVISVPVTVTDSSGAEAEDVLVLTVTGTNDAPELRFGSFHEVLHESFENFRSTDGWHIEKGSGEQNMISGDHGAQWFLTDEGLEIQRGNVGGSLSADGESHIELDGHHNLSLSTNVNIVEEQDYTLNFSYKPRPQNRDSSDMTVVFGGREVFIESDSAGVVTISSEDNVRWQITEGADGWSVLSVVFPSMSGPEAELRLAGAGRSDSLGAYVDDIHLGYVAVSDDYIVAYTEGDQATPIVDETFLISDSDDVDLQSMTVVLTNGSPDDQLILGDLPEGITAELVITQDGSIGIELTGNASHADYRQALEQVQFVNTGDFPNEAERVIEITASDRHDNSNTVVTRIQVAGVNDAPMVSGAAARVTAVEDQGVVLGVEHFGFEDVDGGDLSAVRFTGDNENGHLMLDGDPVEVGQVVNVEDIVSGRLVFVPLENGSGEGFGMLEYQVSDGEDWSAETATLSIDVVAVADVPEVSVDLLSPKLVAVPGTGEMVTKTIDIENYQDTDSGFTVLGRTIDAEGNLSEASIDNVGTGEGGFAPAGKNAGPDYQLGVDLEHQISEELIVLFDNPTSEATVSFNRLFANEGGSGGHETGHYTLLNGGEVVSEGEFFAESGMTLDLVLGGDQSTFFDQIVFTAKSTYQDGTTKSADASDFVITSVEWQSEENMDMVWETPLQINAGLTDTDGSEELGPILIEGVPPGAVLSAGTLVSGGEAADFQATSISIREESQARIIFDGETAGYKNSLGYYKIDPESGEIKDVQILWTNASLKGSGGSLIAGESALGLDISAGDQVGFFIVADGSSKNDYDNLGTGHYEFRDQDGTGATATSHVPELVFVGEDGGETMIKGHVYHSVAGNENFDLNPDGINHTSGELDLENGQLSLGFEDLFGGGDKDFDDSKFTIELGQKNTDVLADENAGFSTWQVNPEDLEGLSLTLPTGWQEPFELSVSAISTESSGDSAETSATIEIEVGENGPYVESVEPEVEILQAEGVALNESVEDSHQPEQDNLEQYLANDKNGGEGLPESLEEFVTESEEAGEDEVPSLEEQVVQEEQEAEAQKDSGISESELTPVEGASEPEPISDDAPPVV